MKNDKGFERERGGNLWANLEESKEKKIWLSYKLKIEKLNNFWFTLIMNLVLWQFLKVYGFILLNDMTSFESEDGVGGQENSRVPTLPSQLSLTTNL